MSIPNDPNPVDLKLRDLLSDLRRKFFNALIAMTDAKDEDDKPVRMTAAELTVIRGVLRDNGMVIVGDFGDEARKALEATKAAGLPEFDDEEENDEG